MVQAAYYSAASDSPSMDFSFARGVSMNDALAMELNVLRDRIRYELRQNAPAKGLLRVYANACIATGPTLSIDTDLEGVDWAEEAEFEFAEWARSCGYVRGESLAELLHLGVRTFFRAGEYFSAVKFDGKADTSVKMRLMQIKPERVSKPIFNKGGCVFNQDTVIEGIEFDSDCRPAYYHIEQDTYTWARESAKNIHHVFYQEEPEQVRGEPWLAAGLPDLHKRRRYDEARVAAAIVAAKFAIFITNNDPSIMVSPEDLLPSGVVDINDGAATILPPHCGVQSFSGAQPTTGAENFRREMIANAGAGIGMSANASNQDSSTSNFASARYDDVGFGLEQKVVRELIANRDLTPMATRWLREAASVGVIGQLPRWYRLIWRWPVADRHTDPLKAANADEKRVSSAAATLGMVWSEHGHAKEQMRQEILEEVDWFRANGLAHPLDSSMVRQEPTEDDAKEDDE